MIFQVKAKCQGACFTFLITVKDTFFLIHLTVQNAAIEKNVTRVGGSQKSAKKLLLYILLLLTYYLNGPLLR